MKKNWFLRIGLIALVLALATTCLVGGTFARYTTTVLGTDTIQVARFGFAARDVGDVAYTTAPEQTVNLFNNATTAATGTVRVEGAQMYLAPGVGGSFYIVLDALTTDVDLLFTGSSFAASVANGNFDALEGTGLDEDTNFISYKFAWGVGGSIAAAKSAITEAPAETPVMPTSYTRTRTNLTQMDADLTARLASFIVAKNTAVAILVYYEWVENVANNDADTDIGQGILDNCSIKALVTVQATQIMTASPVATPTGAFSV